jgi:hypothetical protein
MAKITEVNDNEQEIVATNISEKNKATAPNIELLKFQLSSGLDAVFKKPNAVDLIAAEKLPGAVSRTESGTGMTTAIFYREIGKRCCVSWGKAKKIPSEIRSGDDSKLSEFFMKLLNVTYIESGNCSMDVEEEATENEAGDRFIPKEVKLTNGDTVVFRQVLNKDIEQIEKVSSTTAITSVEQYLKLACQTVTKINGKPTNWAEVQTYFYELTGEDYIRVYLTLRSF